MRITWSAMVLILVGCGSTAHDGPDAGSGPVDARTDAGTDAAPDAMPDAMPDAGLPCARVGYPTPPVVDPSPGAAEMVLGDWNGDGKLDLAASDRTKAGLRVWLGNGDGTFRRVADVALDASAGKPVAFDANGDGKLDLATTQGALGVAVVLGNGDGTFQPPQDFATGPGPFSVGAGDFNNDGIPDLVTSNLDDLTVSLLLGVGDGTFSAHRDAKAGFEQTGQLAVGELTGDNRLDVAVVDVNNDRVTIVAGDGAGGLQITTDVRIGTSTSTVAITDMNRDGHNDLVALASDDHLIAVASGNAQGQFQTTDEIEVDYFPGSLVVGDLNGDGWPDLVVGAAFGGGTLEVILNDGAGKMLPPRRMNIGNAVPALAIGDLDGDGVLDVLASDGNEGPAVLRGRGDGTLVTAASYDAGFMLITTTGDLDGDGNPDVVGASPPGNGSTASVSRGRPDGTFAAPQQLQLDDRPTAIAIGDLNGDGIGDLVIGRETSQELGVQLGDTSAGFGASINSAAGARPSAIALGDFDGDGVLDAAVGDLAGNDVHILLGHRDGSFGAPTSFLAGGAQRALAAGDIDHDGVLDLIVQLDGVGEVAVLHGRGDGTFDDGLEYLTSSTTGAVTRDLRLADLDRDGRIDVIAFNTIAAGNTIAVLRGKADGTLADPIESPAAILVAPINPDVSAPILAVGDLDRDGQLDVIVTSGTAAAIAVLYGRGDGSFRPRVDYKTGPGPSTPIIADVDHDGIPDIVTFDGALQVLKGTCL